MAATGKTASPADRLLGQGSAFATALAQWFARERRILPWRENPSAYKTVVSELMLQQTQVVTALPYFERWIARWPDFAALAAASEAQVLQMWEGLGYYSRARNLLKLAQAWVAAGEKPVTAAQWLEYPGVGPYTAAAIASIAFGKHAAVVDGNVVRILARLCADGTDYPSAAHAVKAFTPVAQGIIIHAQVPGLHNEAMMELGATLCRKGQPQCLLCPVEQFCAGRSLGQEVDALPRIARKKVQERRVDRLFVVDQCRNAVLLHRYGGSARRLAGLCELPLWQDVACAVNTFAKSSPLADVSPSVASPEPVGALLPAQPQPSAKPLLVRHRGIANERIEERFYVLEPSQEATLIGMAGALSATIDGRGANRSASVTDGQPVNLTAAAMEVADNAGGLFWQSLDALDVITLTGPHRRWLSQLLGK